MFYSKLVFSNGSSGKVPKFSSRIHQPRTFSPNPLFHLPKTTKLPTHCRYESPPPQAPDLAIDPDARPVLFTIPPAPLPAPAVTYSISTHADCKSMNLIYQLQCTECNAFYIAETRCSLLDCTKCHQFTTTVLNPHLPVAIHTQSYQIPFQECWSVSVIHKLPDSTPGHIRCQFETAYQLVLQSRHIPDLNTR